MQTAHLFTDNNSQIIRLPKDYHFNGEKIYIQKIGEAVLLVPYDKDWEVFIYGLNSFSDDFMSDGRHQDKEQKRVLL